MAKQKKFMVVARSERVPTNGLNLGSKHVDFHGKTAKIVTDPGVADEIDKVYGLKGNGDVWVERDENLENHVNYHGGEPVGIGKKATHNYFFGYNKRFAEEYDRIFRRYVTPKEGENAIGEQSTVQENRAIV